MNIKKGKLNYDHSGRAYPDNPRVKENWDSIWEYRGKYYKLVGDDEHKEWEQVNIYNQIIEAVGQEYTKWFYDNAVPSVSGKPILNGEGILTRGEFTNKCKTNPKFSETWGLKIEERELSQRERLQLLWKVCREENIPANSKELDNFWLRYNEIMNKHNIPTKLITITYNNETIESYES